MDNEDCRDIEERFILFRGKTMGVDYYAFHPSDTPLDPKCESVDVFLERGDERYCGTFITIGKIQECLNRYKETGENNHGAYFDMENPIIVEEINQGIVERTIEDFLRKGCLEPFFVKSG